MQVRSFHCNYLWPACGMRERAVTWNWGMPSEARMLEDNADRSIAQFKKSAAGAVARTCYGPEDPSWHESAERPARTDDLFTGEKTR